MACMPQESKGPVSLSANSPGLEILKTVTRPTLPNVSNAMVNMIININGKNQNLYSSCSMRHS